MKKGAVEEYAFKLTGFHELEKQLKYRLLVN